MAGQATSVHVPLQAVPVNDSVPEYPLLHEHAGAPLAPAGQATIGHDGEPVHAPSEHVYVPVNAYPELQMGAQDVLPAVPAHCETTPFATVAGAAVHEFSVQLPVYAFDEVLHVRDPVLPATHVQLGAPDENAGHATRVQLPVYTLPTNASVLAYPLLHAHDGAPAALAGQATSVHEPV